jgi:hypothetical protein
MVSAHGRAASGGRIGVAAAAVDAELPCRGAGGVDDGEWR